MYDAVKVIHHSPLGALICLFVCFSRGVKSAEFGYCDVCDSCVLWAVSFSPDGCFGALLRGLLTPNVTLIERLTDNYHSDLLSHSHLFYILHTENFVIHNTVLFAISPSHLWFQPASDNIRVKEKQNSAVYRNKRNVTIFYQCSKTVQPHRHNYIQSFRTFYNSILSVCLAPRTKQSGHWMLFLFCVNTGVCIIKQGS